MDNYKMIEIAKDRAVGRANSDTVEYTTVDVVGKIEVTPENKCTCQGMLTTMVD